MTDSANLKNTHSFAPYMKHYGKTPEEQLEKNKPAMELLKKWMAEEVSEELGGGLVYGGEVRFDFGG